MRYLENCLLNKFTFLRLKIPISFAPNKKKKKKKKELDEQNEKIPGLVYIPVSADTNFIFFPNKNGLFVICANLWFCLSMETIKKIYKVFLMIFINKHFAMTPFLAITRSALVNANVTFRSLVKQTTTRNIYNNIHLFSRRTLVRSRSSQERN